MPKVVKKPPFKSSILLSFVYLALALGISHLAGVYSNSVVSNQIPDFFLSILPVVDTNLIYGPLAVIFWFTVFVLLVKSPHKAPFVLVCVSTLLIVRSFFVFTIHPGHIMQDQTRFDPVISFFSFQKDYFFSAHTANPFLMSLIFWKNKEERLIFLTLSIIFGIAVLLGRMHYSVDVFSAFFITYCVYVFCKSYFKKDFHMFRGY